MVSGNLGTPFLLSPFPFFALRNEKSGGGGGGGGISPSMILLG